MDSATCLAKSLDVQGLSPALSRLYLGFPSEKGAASAKDPSGPPSLACLSEIQVWQLMVCSRRCLRAYRDDDDDGDDDVAAHWLRCRNSSDGLELMIDWELQ